MIKRKLSVALLALCLNTTVFGQAEENKCIFISTSHLDTQWNWNARTTIGEYILNTMNQNFSLFEKYPDFQFNFEAAIHYMWMKEYYPQEYEKLKKYIAEGRWHISGGSVDANDVMLPSAESIIRNFLYGQSYYKKEFGHKGGSDVMLPDCFGFPYSLPTLAKHCGATGFHTQKLSWGSAYDYKSLPPFGIWKGVDGSEIYAVFKGEAYDAHKEYNKDMSKDASMLKITNDNYKNYGLATAFRYVGPMGDRGGGLEDNPSEEGENTPYWLQQSMNSNGPVKVAMWSPDAVFQYLDENKNDKYPIWDNELPMTTHGTGCYTSQAIMKYWNRRNELLADATEKASVAAAWTGGAEYPADMLTRSWIRLLWHHFHDDLTGTSVPDAYNISYNDEVLVNKDLAGTLTGSVGALVRQMDTQVEGIPLVVYNPLSLERTDIVEASVTTALEPAHIRVLDNNGTEVLSQITGYDPATGKLSFLFKATVASLGYATYDLRLDEQSTLTSALTVTETMLENERFTVTLNAQSGDVKQIRDNKYNKDLLRGAIRMYMFSDRSTTFPAWEIPYSTLNSAASTVDENVKVTIAERGPLRVSLKVSRTKNGSEFTQYIRLTDIEVSDRIDFVNEVDWQSRGQLLKVAFPLENESAKATYDLSIGAIERGNNKENLYEVAGHQWADVSGDTYGVSILNDCKYGWDKPSDSTIRLTLIHTPSVADNYIYQKDQDLGLNKFTYSVYGHQGKWGEDTQWAASRLNQPMLAFQAPKHAGALGKSFGFASLNTDKVAVKALKKAEDSDEIIVRVYELTGSAQDGVELSFPASIVSAREVNGIEEAVGDAAYTGNKLSFNIGRFQPKTFAVKLASPEKNQVADAPSSYPVTMKYNRDIMSYDAAKNDMASDIAINYAYPAELLSDKLMVDGIEFQIGNRELRQRNVLMCREDEITIDLPSVSNAKKLYILAASSNANGTTAEFTLGGKSYSFHVPYWAETIGAWETDFNQGTKYCRENVAFTATHRHTKDGKNDLYGFMHIYKYALPVTGEVSKLSIATNDDLYIFAMTLSDNENDDTVPASELTSLPMPAESQDGACSRQLTPLSVQASHQNGNNESGVKATDGDLTTKWCVTNSSSPWLELVFDGPVEICHWFVMNAGIESTDYITVDFRLQRYDNGDWIDVDVVKGNTLNKVHRYVPSFTTDRVRLQIDRGGQKDTTTRILEFALYGNNQGVGIEKPVSDANTFRVEGNFPNPFSHRTTIRCQVPQGAKELTLRVYDCMGRMVSQRAYPATTSDIQELEWENPGIGEGIYLYTIFVLNGERVLVSNTGKMIIGKFTIE